VGQFAVVVIGASLGGVEALKELASGLKQDIAAAVFVVQHVGANESSLPEILDRRGPLPVCHAKQGELVRQGRILIAPPDHHLVFVDGGIRLTRGPRENWARPAIDPLFRSAAMAYGPRVIGVILTGALNDGTAGLKEVRARGGIAVVQDPKDAACPAMPISALRHAGADFRVPLRDMPSLLQHLASGIVDNKHVAPQAETA
jgi:two-component system chemotaxis response regulator CheB